MSLVIYLLLGALLLAGSLGKGKTTLFTIIIIVAVLTVRFIFKI